VHLDAALGGKDNWEKLIIHYNMGSKIGSKYRTFDILRLDGFIVWSKKICGLIQSPLKSVNSNCPKSADWIFQRLDLSASEVILSNLQIWAKVIQPLV